MTTDASTHTPTTHNIDGITIVPIVHTTTPWVLTVSLDGYLDIRNTPVFSRAIEQTLNEYPNITQVVFDLARLTYISSTGIGAFTEILIFTRNLNIEMTLCELHDNVYLVFEALGFSSFFSIVDDSDRFNDDLTSSLGASG